MTDTSRLGRIVWYELLTTDMKAAEQFYTAVMGWTVKPFRGAPEPYDVVARPDGGDVGGVMTIPAGMNVPPHWEMYLAVNNLDETIARIERLGGSGLSPVIEVPSVGRLRTMQDPQGAVFAIIEPESREERPETEPAIGEGSWHELYTTDAAAALQFYTEVFGWKPTDPMDMGPMGKYYMFGRAFQLGGMMNKPPEMAQAPPHWNLYFRVPDVHAAAERVKANGGQVLNGPMEVPGNQWIVNCTDPQGAAVSFHHT
jgi:predicted enzyme related to lactoylglutathione lyase